jgi:hypothetical protein
MLLLEKFIICPGEESDIFRWCTLFIHGHANHSIATYDVIVRKKYFLSNVHKCFKLI